MLLLLLALAPFAASADATLDDARRLIQAGEPQKAFEMLAPLEDERAGEPVYDYLLGLSALDAGQPSVAVFALERVVAVQPDNAPARAQLARAYFDLRDNQLAQQEFENVRKMASTDEVETTIAKYLDALELRFDSQRPAQWRGYVQGGVGYDSNANSAGNDSTVAIPALGGLVLALAPAGVEQNSLFFDGEVGLSLTRRLQPELHAVVGGRTNVRDNTASRAETFGTGTTNFDLGLTWSRGRNSVTGVVQAEWFRIDHDCDSQHRGLHCPVAPHPGRA